ncbi:hypothetical protein [Dyadobacter chenwenxiniae]|nr:hypothetical protein [Dyadobacter chenwenxiniae]
MEATQINIVAGTGRGNKSLLHKRRMERAFSNKTPGKIAETKTD